MLPFPVKSVSPGDVGLSLILICSGCFDLTLLLSGTNAYISIRDSAEQETSIWMWDLKQRRVTNHGAIKIIHHK